MFHGLRAFADIGRTQGITTTASIAIVGAFTSTASVEWYYYIVYFTLIGAIAHMSLNTFIAVGDKELDAQTYVPSRNPISAGILSKKAALRFVLGGTLACVALIVFLLVHIDVRAVLVCLLCFVISYGSLLWYGWRGKRVILSYDFTFSVSYAFFVLFGVFAVGGAPTIYTWIFIGVVVFAASAFAQWENGLKDADADRFAGVRSFAVVTRVKNNKRLSLTHPYFLYGVALKIGFLLFCFSAFYVDRNIYFLLFLLLYGIPSQVYVMYRFLKKEHPMDHRRTILLDVAFAAILGYPVIVGKTGVLPILLLVVYLIGGYLIGSQLQTNCEFKFGRFLTSRE